MSSGRQHRRREERTFKRIPVRYGERVPEHAAFAQQLSSGGLFLSTNGVVFGRGSAVVIEIKGPAETWIVSGIVRHAYKVHPNMARFTKPGMGVEFTEASPACRTFLASM